MKRHRILALGLALAASSTPAWADGQGFVRFECGTSDPDFRVDGFEDSDAEAAFGVRGGYWFTPNVAIGGFYSRYYSESFDDGFDTYSLKLHGVGVGVVGKKNFGGEQQGFFVMGRAGIARGAATVDYDGDVEETEAGSTKPYFGGGVGYDFSPAVGLGINHDQIKSGGDGGDVTAKALTLGLELRF